MFDIKKPRASKRYKLLTTYILRFTHSAADVFQKPKHKLPHPYINLRDETLKLFWARDSNFGDWLSRDVVAFISGKAVSWSSMSDCDLCALGSIYGWAHHSIRRRYRPLHIWGSGILVPEDLMGSSAGLIHHLVRGPITEMYTRVKPIPYGDPGLLAPESYRLKAEMRANQIGIVLHYTQMRNPDILRAVNLIPNAVLIDPRTMNSKGVVEKISSCEFIMSSGLHGLIIADALGIPNAWLAGSEQQAFWNLKFFDYFLSIGRPLRGPFDLRANTYSEIRELNALIEYNSGVENAKASIHASFPRVM